MKTIVIHVSMLRLTNVSLIYLWEINPGQRLNSRRNLTDETGKFAGCTVMSTEQNYLFRPGERRGDLGSNLKYEKDRQIDCTLYARHDMLVNQAYPWR